MFRTRFAAHEPDTGSVATRPPVTLCSCGNGQAVTIIQIGNVQTPVCEDCLADHSDRIPLTDSAADAA
jgi:hypothetical protein